MKIRLARSIDIHFDDDGNMHLVLVNAKGRPIAGAVLTFDEAEMFLDEAADAMEDYLDQIDDEEIDTIGECAGSA